MGQYEGAGRRLAVEGLESRRCLSAASAGWDGPGLGSADLTYYIGPVPATLDAAEVRGAIETALDAWAQEVDVSFTPTDTPGQRDSIDFTFASIDGALGTLAYAYFPDDVNPWREAGDVRFDLDERWEIGNGQGAAAVDLTLVAAHEIGHALGLDHSPDGLGVMAASISTQQQFHGLDPRDVDDALTLYAPALPPSSAPFSPAGDDMESGWEGTVAPEVPQPYRPWTGQPELNRPTPRWWVAFRTPPRGWEITWQIYGGTPSVTWYVPSSSFWSLRMWV